MDTEPIKLSYLVITKNKLPYLKNRLEKFFEEKKEDEEILISDGESTDGTREYVEQLKKEGKISYHTSENDVGIAHALNKLALHARGTLIRFITDDDAFSYPVIKDCKEFMLAHPKIDIIFTNGGTKDQTREKPVRPLIYHPLYEKWLKNRSIFTATDLGAMFRRSSIPLLGLWNTSFPAPDAEFTFRTMTSKANVAWCTGFSFVNVSTPQSVSIAYMRQIKKDMDRLNKYYLNKNPDSFITEKWKVLRNKLRSWSATKSGTEGEWRELVVIAEKWLNEKYRGNKPIFLWNKS